MRRATLIRASRKERRHDKSHKPAFDIESTLNTDEAKRCVKIGRTFKDHQTVDHTVKEYVRGTAHTNTLGGYFAIFKKGMKGVYQHSSETHLHRY